MAAFKRNTDATEMAGWRVVNVSPEKLVRVFCGPVVCDADYRLSQGPRLAVTTPPSSLVLLSLFVGLEASPTWRIFISVDGTPTRYRGTIFLPRSEHSFRKQSKPNGKEYPIPRRRS